MAESKSLVKSQRLLLVSDSDMAAAAQQLLQLSDEDNKSSSSSNSNGNNNNNNMMKINRNRKGFLGKRDEITSAKMQEIFGKEDEILRPIKKRRYRLLQNLYKETKPIKVSYGKNLWY